MSYTFDLGHAPRVLVTRPAEDAPSLASALSRSGYVPVVVPLLERHWHVDAVMEAASTHPEASWVIVTSGTAAQILATAAPGAWTTARWAAVGQTTAHRLKQLGMRVDLVPERATAADLVRALGDVTGLRIVYPRADLASPATTTSLRQAGAEVLDVVAYDNVAPPGHARRLLRELPVRATTLLSASAARRLAAAVPTADRSDLGQVVCIGPSTARAAHAEGLRVDAVADPHSVAGLLDALERTVRAS
ncbi:MAG: uroporphyrinogen-III synthase [Myxococcales bacterium]|nr:uroporphyrinogen-III synthase [Myxococcales bacterium]